MTMKRVEQNAALKAELKSTRLLHKAIRAAEAGGRAKADEMYDRSLFWFQMHKIYKGAAGGT